jgi:hypothetical protein
MSTSQENNIEKEKHANISACLKEPVLKTPGPKHQTVPKITTL